MPDWRSLAHRTRADLAAAGLELLLDHTAPVIDPAAKQVTVTELGRHDVQVVNDVTIVWRPGIGCWRRPPTCPLAPPPTSRAASPAKPRSAAPRSSPGRWAPRWSRCSSWPWPARPARPGRRCGRPRPGDRWVGRFDHKAYHPGAHRLHLRITGDRQTGPLLGAQLLDQRAQVAKRIDEPPAPPVPLCPQAPPVNSTGSSVPGDDLEAMRAFCGQVDQRVQALLAHLQPPTRRS